MIDSSIPLYGVDVSTLPNWAHGAEVPLEIVPDGTGLSIGSDYVIDAASGPLGEKKRRLQYLESIGTGTVISASTTALVASQRGWTGGKMRIVGIDPLLMAAPAATITVVDARAADLQWLSTVWPSRTFLNVPDAVGLVFTREILPIINEAVDFLHRGLSSEDIDRGVQLGLNYPKGPMAWAEQFGWRSVFWGLRALEDMYGPRFRPHPWIRAQIGGSLLDGESGLEGGGTCGT